MAGGGAQPPPVEGAKLASRVRCGPDETPQFRRRHRAEPPHRPLLDIGPQPSLPRSSCQPESTKGTMTRHCCPVRVPSASRFEGGRGRHTVQKNCDNPRGSGGGRPCSLLHGLPPEPTLILWRDVALPSPEDHTVRGARRPARLRRTPGQAGKTERPPVTAYSKRVHGPRTSWGAYAAMLGFGGRVPAGLATTAAPAFLAPDGRWCWTIGCRGGPRQPGSPSLFRHVRAGGGTRHIWHNVTAGPGGTAYFTTGFFLPASVNGASPSKLIGGRKPGVMVPLMSGRDPSGPGARASTPP